MEKEEKEFLRIQEETFKRVTNNSFGSARMFMPESGICYYCHKDVIAAELQRGNNGSDLVTGCRNCFHSYCD